MTAPFLNSMIIVLDVFFSFNGCCSITGVYTQICRRHTHPHTWSHKWSSIIIHIAHVHTDISPNTHAPIHTQTQTHTHSLERTTQLYTYKHTHLHPQTFMHIHARAHTHTLTGMSQSFWLHSVAPMYITANEDLQQHSPFPHHTWSTTTSPSPSLVLLWLCAHAHGLNNTVSRA